MAARWLSSRLLQRVASQRPHTLSFPSRIPESLFQPLPYSNLIFRRCTIPRREIQTQSEPSIEENNIIENSKSCTDKAELSVPDFQTGAQNPAKSTCTSNLKVSSRHDLALVFTCKVCETRSMKTCCRESYDKGVVVVRCSGCDNLHLIADRLGWFGEPGSVEDLLAARGEGVKKGSTDSLNFTLEDFAGKKL